MVYLIRRRKLGRGSCRGIKTFSRTGIGVFRNDKANIPPAELVFRWGCTSDLPGNPKVINKAEAIHLVSDKLEFRKRLNEADLCPDTYFTKEEVCFPAVVRPRVHAQGRKLWVANNYFDLEQAIMRCPNGWYASQLINKTAEYRVFVAQGRAVWVAKKTPGNPDQVAWNVAQGGRFDNVRWDEWPLKAVRVSIEAFKLSGLDFGGVDVMVDAEGECYVLEINAAPSQTSPYRQECVAKAFDYIVRNGKQEIPMVDAKGGYKKFIHPAVSAEAQMVGA